MDFGKEKWAGRWIIWALGRGGGGHLEGLGPHLGVPGVIVGALGIIFETWRPKSRTNLKKPLVAVTFGDFLAPFSSHFLCLREAFLYVLLSKKSLK